MYEKKFILQKKPAQKMNRLFHEIKNYETITNLGS